LFNEKKGGKRCDHPSGCLKLVATAQSTKCAKHGGGNKCQFQASSPEDGGMTSCSRRDAGGGFCLQHGGGKRCQEEVTFMHQQENKTVYAFFLSKFNSRFCLYRCILSAKEVRSILQNLLYTALLLLITLFGV
jgi:hypothetical protein